MKPKILFIYSANSTFVKADRTILEEKFDVNNFCFPGTNGLIKMIIRQISLLFWLLINIWKAKSIYIWFADYHSFFPTVLGKLLFKDVFLVIGGYDVIHLPEIKYGSLKNPIRKFCTLKSIKYASKNLAVSNYILKKIGEIVPEAKSVLCYNAVKSDLFQPNYSVKQNVILTVGIIDSLQRFKLKGIDIFLEVAKNTPEYEFIIVGITNELLKQIGEFSSNVKTYPIVDQKELIELYQEAKVYCQFSMVESFCLTLNEAMLCGSTGIVLNNGALSEVLGGYGKILENNEINNAKDEIEKLIQNFDKNVSEEARQYVRENYSISRRKEILQSIMLDNQGN
ncbi:MAG: glycosyltransferase family 4 protein [Rhodothermaceae bacterium]